MKEYISTLSDSFIDYAGKVHHFTIAAISKTLEDVAAVTASSTEYGIALKGLYLGIAICNPIDTYSKELGTYKAIARARNSDAALFASDPGFINTKLVNAFMEQEASYLKNNPEKYIKGYSEAKIRFLKKQEMEQLGESFGELENTIIEEVTKDPKYLNKIEKYLKWKSNQSK